MLLTALAAAAVAAVACKQTAVPYMDVTVPGRPRIIKCEHVCLHMVGSILLPAWLVFSAVRAGMPVWEQSRGLPKNWRTLHLALADGDEVNQVQGVDSSSNVYTYRYHALTTYFR
jgi:hypothetical protein